MLRGGAGKYANHLLHADCGVTFHAIDVIGGGRCMFRTMAVHLFGNEQAFQPVIDQCVQYVCNHWADLGIISMTCHAGYGDASCANAYRRFMQYGFAYGSSTEIFGIAAAFNVHISVLNEAGVTIINSDSRMNVTSTLPR